MADPLYTEYHPRWHRRRVSTWWWIGSWPYLRFTLRELSSVFVAYAAAVVIWQAWAIARGPAAFAASLQALRSPAMVALTGLSLSFILFHAITWFALAPRAMVLRLGDRRVPDAWIAGAGYAAWAGASVIVAWVVLEV